jgi:Zn-finger nucleic acid-binding protein
MKCPNDGTTLTMSERSGIEIDYCPDCRGVWLDRGELDKIIERSLTQPAAAPPPPPAQQGHQQQGYREQGYEQQGYQQRPAQHGYPRKRKESWLSELFD